MKVIDERQNVYLEIYIPLNKSKNRFTYEFLEY